MKKGWLFLVGCLILSLLQSCVSKNVDVIDNFDDEEPVEFIEKKSPGGNYGVFYQIFVGSFASGSNNGKGDLRGIIQRMDYLNNGNIASNRSLNVDGIWLTPVHPSRSYHKYDVMDFMAIDRSFGTMADFEELISECKKRGIKVIIDLVINHTSSEHPWFLTARRGDQKYMAYYNLSNTRLSDKYHPLGFGGMFYEAEFWHQMPDLNLDNPEVREEIKSIINFWIEKGVAGFRLDAVSKYHTDNHPKNIEFLKWFTEYCKSVKNDVYVVAEAWESAGIVMNYYDSQIPSMFNFAMSDEKGILPIAVATRNGANLTTAMVNWNKAIKEKNPGGIDAVFISNHDQNRSAGYFNQDPVKIKMAAALYLTMPGNPFIYYGEEIGMTGSGVDPNKRSPMVWSVNNSAGIPGRPPGMTQRFRPNAGVAEQLRNPNSIARFYIEAVRLRNRYPVLFYGEPEELKTGDRAIASWTISAGEIKVAVVHNLSAAEKKLIIDGVQVLGGTLTADSTGGVPSFDRTTLTLPPFSTALLELNELIFEDLE